MLKLRPLRFAFNTFPCFWHLRLCVRGKWCFNSFTESSLSLVKLQMGFYFIEHKIGIERSVNSKESTLKETTTNKTNFQNVCILSFVIQFFHWNTSWFQKADHGWLKGEKILKFKSLVHLWSVFLVYFCGSVTIMRHMVLLTHPSPLDFYFCLVKQLRRVHLDKSREFLSISKP